VWRRSSDAHIAQPTTTEASTIGWSYFLELPRELRDMIIEEVLIFDEEVDEEEIADCEYVHVLEDVKL
jgi:hypothetical protein